MEQGYIKRTITFILPTQAGDKFLNRADWDFISGKMSGGEMIVVEEKINIEPNEKGDKTS